MKLLEAYNIVGLKNQKLTKSENTLIHYTNKENFIKIINSGYLQGSTYHVDSYTYRGRKKGANSKDTELCMVRSDMAPDRSDKELSSNIGDIKLIMNKQHINNKYRIKPIAEIPIENGKYVEDAVKELTNKTSVSLTNELSSAIKNSKSPKEIKKVIDKLKESRPLLFRSQDKLNLLTIIYKNYTEIYNHIHNREGEERVQLKGNNLPLKDNVSEILIPDYLKNDKNILNLIPKIENLKIKFNWYKCLHPKE